MRKEYDYVLEVKRKLQKADWNFEKKDILRKAVKDLRDKGYSDFEIREIFKIDHLKEQDNSQMVSNNTEYINLLNDVLNS